MREISGTDGYYTQYTCSIYFLLPKSAIDLFSRHCAKKKCVCNRKEINFTLIYIQICLGKPKLVWKKKKKRPPVKKKNLRDPT